jgi:hypothetical protein
LLQVGIALFVAVWMLAAWMVSWPVELVSRCRRDRAALELVERSADLGDHRVPDDEPDPGVGRVDDVVTGQVGRVAGMVLVVMFAPMSLWDHA